MPTARSDVAHSGRLGVDERGRVTFGGAALVAAPGSGVTPDGAVHLVGFGTHRIGAALVLGGARLEAGSPWLPAVARSCTGSTWFLAYEV